MGFDIEEHIMDDEPSPTQINWFDNFDAVLAILIIKPYGGRLYQSLRTLFVEELDLPENLINLLQQNNSHHENG